MAKFYDTLIWEYLKNPWERGLSLDDLAMRQFDYEKISYKEITNNNKINFSEVDLETATKYSVEDVYITHKLYKKQLEELSEEDKKILDEIDFPLLEVLRTMENNWVKIDEKKLEEIGDILKKELKILQDEIFELAWSQFNINSPKQVGYILFEKLDLPKGKKTKTWYSVNAEVLENLAKNFPIAEKIVTFRHYNKLLSTYVEGLLDLVNKETWKIHSSFNQTIVSTWRLSSTNPNLQNIPQDDGLAWEIRKAFVPFEKGDKLMAFDYSQVELRLLAILSWDKELLQAFKNWEDIHARTAKFIFEKEEISSKERSYAKMINFSVVYWVSAFSLAKRLDISQKEAKKYIDTFFERYSGVREFFNKMIKTCEEIGYVETMFGRKRFIKWINDRNKLVKTWAEREAINSPIQGSAADIIKIAMIKVQEFLTKNNLKSQMIIQVHDELVFNVKADEEEVITKNIVEIMESIIEAEIVLKVDYNSWKNWKEAK